jgi:hypothetical protein
VSSRAKDPLRRAVDQVAEAFGMKKLELFIAERGATHAVAEVADRPWVVAPAALAKRPEAEQLFEMAAALGNAARGVSAVDVLGDDALAGLLAAATRHAVPAFGAGLPGAKGLDEQAKAIAKALPRGTRKQLAALGQAYADADVDVATFSAALRRSARCFAAVLVDDLGAALASLQRHDAALASLEGAALVRRSGAVAEVLGAWCSDKAHAWRRAAKYL